MLLRVARLALAPLLYGQARRLRATALELPEPGGARQGEEGLGRTRLRVLVAGDSSAVGVGAPTQDQALAQPLARQLAQRLRGRIRWQLIAQSGLTSEGLLQYLRLAEVMPADVAVIVLGVNDVAREVPLGHALRKRAEVVAWLRQQAEVGTVLFTSMPDMQHFPLIPQPLAWYAGARARRNNAAQSKWAATLSGVVHVDLVGLLEPQLMAHDGYHPSPALYARVAARLAESIVRDGLARQQAAADRAAGPGPAKTQPDRAPAGDE